MRCLFFCCFFVCLLIIVFSVCGEAHRRQGRAEQGMAGLGGLRSRPPHWATHGRGPWDREGSVDPRRVRKWL